MLDLKGGFMFSFILKKIITQLNWQISRGSDDQIEELFNMVEKERNESTAKFNWRRKL